MANQIVVITVGRIEARVPRVHHQRMTRETAAKVNRELQGTTTERSWFGRVTAIRQAIRVQTYGELHESGQWGQEE